MVEFLFVVDESFGPYKTESGEYLATPFKNSSQLGKMLFQSYMALRKIDVREGATFSLHMKIWSVTLGLSLCHALSKRSLY